MEVLKPVEAVALDDVTRAGQELIERLDTIVALQLHDDELRQVLERHGERLAGEIDELCERRRRAGDLPAAGNMERAELAAIAMKARSFFSNETETPQVAAALIEEYRMLHDLIDDARAVMARDHPLHESLHGLDALLGEIGEEVRGFL